MATEKTGTVHEHMTGHKGGKQVGGVKKSMAPSDFNPSGHNSKHG